MLINPMALPTFALAAVLFWMGFKCYRDSASRTSRPTLLLLAVPPAVPCFVCDLYYTHLFDSWMWFYRFRAMRYSELTFAGIALLAGILHRKFDPETIGEKLFFPVVLFVILGAPFSKSVLAPVDLDRLQQSCNTEVCLQSTPSTCGPTSAATILKSYGSSASEKELAKAAFSYRGGTESWYLARALQHRGFDTEFVFQLPDAKPFPAPSIAGVVLPGGAGHFVAVLSSTPDHVVIGDPLVGKVELNHPSSDPHYRFTGFFMVIRRKSSR